ncbi:putative dna repair [Cucumis melo var. makuwa]|uniref:Dna repair n=1 Tax=Cucumis melo var. makuwa TaxID=1194695 RepID=A0A5D3BMU7_CUCMM|nr:putative dna repair [Cucumis melo var. makuwa]TYK00310.1 putative dna repair [Cucumis melo var. makuwa]
MGLDNFPQTSSSSYCRCGLNLETRSLTESPRNSSSRLSNVDCHHRRLSLQINIQEKENNGIEICEDIIKREKKKVGRKVALVDITNSNNKIGYEIQEIGHSSQSRKVEMKSLKKLEKTTVGESSNSKVVHNNQKNEMVSKKQKLISMPMQILKGRTSEREAFDCPTNNKLLLHHPTIFEPCSYPKGKPKPAGGETSAVDITTTTDGESTDFKYIKTIQISSKENSNWVVPPSTFHHLETTLAGKERRWKKRLELQTGVVGGDRRGRKRGWEFPHAKCGLVEYGLINEDLEKSKLIIIMAEEREGIVKLVELHILDSLLRETLALIS